MLNGMKRLNFWIAIWFVTTAVVFGSVIGDAQQGHWRPLFGFLIAMAATIVYVLFSLRAGRTSSARLAVARAIDNIFDALAMRLHKVAVERGLPIRYASDAEMTPDAVAEYHHTQEQDYWGRERRRGKEILLNREWFRDKQHKAHFALAHEIGHHIAIQRRGDHSEKAAEREAHRLIRSLLTDEELACVGDVVDAVYAKSPALSVVAVFAPPPTGHIWGAPDCPYSNLKPGDKPVCTC